MTFRILISDAIFDTRDCLAAATKLALFEASTLARETSRTVTVKVYRIGTPMHDALGRDCTPAFYIGRAVATPSGVEWQMGVARRTVSRRRVA